MVLSLSGGGEKGIVTRDLGGGHGGGRSVQGNTKFYPRHNKKIHPELNYQSMNTMPLLSGETA